jgi:hypothetical protein
MDDTTDKSVAPDQSTGEGADALTDKDLGQATEDTGGSQDGSDARDNAPQDDSEAEGTDEDTTSEDVGEAEDDSAEESLLTPDEVAKLPKELKAQYVAMNTRFQQRMAEAKDIIREVREALQERGEKGDPAAADAAKRPVLIDRARLAQAKDNEEVIALIEEAILKGGTMAAEQTVQPIRTKEATAEVNSYFKDHPERAKYRRQMAELDTKTKETLTLDELFYAVAGKDLAGADQERKQKKLRDMAKGNSESQSGTTGKSGAEGDIFDEIANAGGRTHSILR